jgi:hypothetical protein
MAPTYTYSYDPSTSSKDAVRFLCQDTDVVTNGAARLCDEEINYILSLQSNVFLAAAQCAEDIAAYWAKTQTTHIGPLSVEHSQAVPFYLQLAARLRQTASRWSNSGPVFYPQNENRYQISNHGKGGPQIQFAIGMDDFPGYSIYWPPPDLPPLYSYP